MDPSLFVFFLMLPQASVAAEGIDEVNSFAPRFLGRLPRLSRVSSLRGGAVSDTFYNAALSDTEMIDQNNTLTNITRLYGATFASGMEKQLNHIRGVLLPVFAASPKNKHGRLDDAPARYALRRVLNQIYGWDMPELGEDDEQDDPTNVSLKLTLGNSLPHSVKLVLREGIVEKGAGLLELSLVVAALQQASVEDMHKRLVAAYRLMLLDVEMRVEREIAQSIIDLHMGAYICGEDLSRMTVSERSKFERDVQNMYASWTEAKRFFRDVQRLVAPDASSFTFADVAGILQRIEMDLPFWNNKQCLRLKQSLMSMELQNSGRVSLLDFYSGALHKGMTQFRETKPYLKSLGALDESDPLEPRVIISNYLDGPSNCISETSHYSLCCIDECGDLYTHIERQVRRPQATPEELILIVKRLSSSSMQRGRLSNAILRRIHDIADHHAGVVPLHGQLFAEWMHFAYPRECTHPQLFGSAHAQTLRQWESAAQHSGGLSDDELRVEVGELETAEIQRMSRESAGDGSDLSETCWTWSGAEMNVTFADEEKAILEHLWPAVWGALRWVATMLFFFCVLLLAKKHTVSVADKGHAKFVQRLRQP
eukprot:TRINITY_DN6248_c0_g1_i1.p1 TRINITY_DN6248_c0_g1~~TRINITY_DN6248_c0_g1_i1.p1  ORF type:complete len:596 (-),score=79.12 TRINITY_DN6248_c0_g1_i1:44-1831(-)